MLYATEQRGVFMLDYLEKLINELKNKMPYDKNNRVFELLSDENTNPTRMIMIGSELYRARKIQGSEPTNISEGFYGYDARGSFVNPNPQNISAMRANREGQPRLYCSNVVYLPLVEIKPEVGQKISLACIQTNEILKLLDLTLYHLEFDMPQEKQDLFRELSYLFSTPIDDDNDDKDDYLVTQEIADYVQELGYDGIAYSSSLVPELNKGNYNGANLVIFKYDHCVPTKSNILKMISKPNQEKYNFDHCEFQQIDRDKNKLVLITSENGKYNFHFTFGSNPDPKIHNPSGINPNVFVSVGRIMFNTPIRIIGKGNVITTYVGSIIRITMKGNKHTETQFTMPGDLNSRLNDLTLALKCIEEGKIWFGDAANPQMGSFSINMPLEQYAKHIDWYKKQFIIATDIKSTLLGINQYFNIDMDNAKDIDRFHTDMLVNCIHRQALIETNHKFNRFQAIDIQGHKVYLIFDKIGNNKYKVSNYFSDTVEISCSFNDIPIQTSQFSLLDAQGFIDATNVDPDIIVSSYKKLYNPQTNHHLPHRANEDLWNVIRAYDISKDSKFLHLAERINEWIESVDYTYINNSHLSFINRCQILKRKGVLGKEEIKKLKQILKRKDIDKVIVPMIHILLNNYSVAKSIYEKLSNQDKEWFSKLPIVNLYPKII